jgi:hypothetical protein
MTSQEEERYTVHNLNLRLSRLTRLQNRLTLLITIWVFFQGGRYFRHLFYYNSLTLVRGENILLPVVNIRSEMCISFKLATVRGKVGISLLYYVAIFIFHILNTAISSQMLQTRCKTKVKLSVSSSTSPQQFVDDRHKWLTKYILCP